MIGDFVTVPITQSDFPDFNVPCEHLVEVATLAMCLSAWVHSRGEVERPQLLDNVSHVVIEVTTYDYRSAWVCLMMSLTTSATLVALSFRFCYSPGSR